MQWKDLLHIGVAVIKHQSFAKAALIASGSSLVATLFAIGLGAFYDGTVMNPSAGFFLLGASALVLAELAMRSDASPLEAVG
ncbi:hypothetical protein BC374_27885 [Ensifer sp. LC13]|nr:hypothetical protein BC362_03385 [Ensifer sp. LC14]OCP02486.1 hypothetical protein BBX50_27870 [Ensifer sp. LC11]OCP02608.1 hypothetical protein BC374_27885 [Ensifer sp. LC13]OCP29831.1 hypothetical protein BC364_27995 [Ensifer sp. LC499]